ncbi:MAG: group III truncated hemoglobin [Niastella sp.]|nr:group III truncated hemoglobin [Niastella sp.]
MQKEITDLDDIKLLVDTFYGNIRENELLAPIFNAVIKDRWPQHLEKMYRFWQTVLLDDHTYYNSPFPPHAKLPVTQQHFDTWLKLWHLTINENFTGKLAEEAKWRGNKMAIMFLNKIQYYSSRSSEPLI